MTFNIIRVLLIVLPFVIVPNEFDCFRTIKESLFQCGAILLLGSLFFDNRIREYKNKYIAWFLVYFSIVFFRFFSMAYIWGVKGKYYSLAKWWNLLPTFNIILGILVLKAVIEYISVDQLRKIVKLSCLITVIVSIHLILQKFTVFQIYGHSDKFSDPNHWTSTNRVIGFLGNPMVAGSWVAISAQFNLFFKDKWHYVAYALGFIAVCVTATTSPVIAFLACFFIWLLIYHRKWAFGLVLVCIPVLWYLSTHFVEFFSPSDRIAVWKKAWDLWYTMPYTGMGLGSFRMQNILVNTTYWWQAHNEWLQIMQELGLIGLGLIGIILIDFFKGFKGFLDDRRVVACGLVVVSGLVNSVMAFPLHIAPTVLLIIVGYGFSEILRMEV